MQQSHRGTDLSIGIAVKSIFVDILYSIEIGFQQMRFTFHISTVAFNLIVGGALKSKSKVSCVLLY